MTGDHLTPAPLTDLDRENARRKLRGMSVMTSADKAERDEMVRKYESLGPGPERDRVSGLLYAFDHPDLPKPVRCPPELRQGFLSALAGPGRVRAVAQMHPNGGSDAS